MGEVAPRGWRDRVFLPEEVSASGNSDQKVLAVHDAETTNSHKAQKKSQNRSTGCCTTGTSYRWTDSPPMCHFGEIETRECEKARQRSQSGPGALTWLRARSVDAERVIPAQKFLGGDIWGSRSTWRRRVPPVVQRTPTRDMQVCASLQARR